MTKTRLCTSVGAETPAELAKKAALALSLGSDLVELRIDRLSGGISLREVEGAVRRFMRRAVITVRSEADGGGFRGSEASRLEMLSRLAEMRPAYLDVELEAARANEEWAGSLPRGVKRIVSWHDFHGTKPLAELRAIYKEGLKRGALAKVVCTARSPDDNLTVLRLCEERPGRVTAFCMGELGMVSRVVSMSLGAPIAYASLPNEAVAPGQLSVSTMKTLRKMVA
ncbi:MAG TPA: type I 3-dehydroquinate dehydratase [Nitrososphaerales archaeon]|nr:type I 3-dehydroquinate dehydratase [Nitrososphaerales archaeon]